MENKYSKILVAVDGSKQAEWAFKKCRSYSTEK